MPGARVVGQFDDGPGPASTQRSRFKYRAWTDYHSRLLILLTADNPCKSFVKEKHSSPGALAIHVHDFVVADPAEPLRENVLGRPRVRPVLRGRSQMMTAKMQFLTVTAGV